jgi:hypothetical protein
MHCEFSALWPDVKIDKPGSKYTVRFLKKSAVLHADSGDLKRTNEEETYSAKGSTMMKPAPSCRQYRYPVDMEPDGIRMD